MTYRSNAKTNATVIETILRNKIMLGLMIVGIILRETNFNTRVNAIVNM